MSIAKMKKGKKSDAIGGSHKAKSPKSPVKEGFDVKGVKAKKQKKMKSY